MELIKERLRGDPAVGSRIDELPAHLFAVEAAAAAVPDASLDAMCDLLLESADGLLEPASARQNDEGPQTLP
jgi:hypothetical protein